jgi:hypothetical protein
MTPRQYKLFLTSSQKFALAVPVVILIVLPIVSFLVFTMGSGAERTNLPPFFPVFPFGFFLLLAGYFGWLLLTLPREITVTHDKKLVFRSALRSLTVRPTDISSIEPRSIRMNVGISGYQLTHLNGKILYPGQFTDMYLLLAELKQVNPSMEIRGC